MKPILKVPLFRSHHLIARSPQNIKNRQEKTLKICRPTRTVFLSKKNDAPNKPHQTKAQLATDSKNRNERGKTMPKTDSEKDFNKTNINPSDRTRAERTKKFHFGIHWEVYGTTYVDVPKHYTLAQATEHVENMRHAIIPPREYVYATDTGEPRFEGCHFEYGGAENEA